MHMFRAGTMVLWPAVVVAVWWLHRLVSAHLTVRFLEADWLQHNNVSDLLQLAGYGFHNDWYCLVDVTSYRYTPDQVYRPVEPRKSIGGVVSCAWPGALLHRGSFVTCRQTPYFHVENWQIAVNNFSAARVPTAVIVPTSHCPQKTHNIS